MTKSEPLSSEPRFSFLLYSSKGANSRKKILAKLLSGSNSCNQIAVVLGLNWRTAYRHLQLLEKENLVKGFGFGQRKLYKLTLNGEAAIKCYIKSKTASSNIKKKAIPAEYCLNDTEKTILLDGGN
jgi:predicted transcriptional regulator